MALNRRWGIGALLGLTIMAGSNVVSAESVYKWEDANGRVHYGQIPPAAAGYLGVEEKRITAVAVKGKSQSVRQTLKNIKQLHDDTERRATDNTKNRHRYAQQRRSQRLCKHASKELRRIRWRYRKGYRLSEWEGLQFREEEARRMIRRHCKD